MLTTLQVDPGAIDAAPVPESGANAEALQAEVERVAAALQAEVEKREAAEEQAATAEEQAATAEAQADTAGRQLSAAIQAVDAEKVKRIETLKMMIEGLEAAEEQVSAERQRADAAEMGKARAEAELQARVMADEAEDDHVQAEVERRVIQGLEAVREHFCSELASSAEGAGWSLT